MSLKEVKQRILSVKNTQKITSAMKLISAAKLRRAQSVIEGVQPYRKRLDNMLLTFLSGSRQVDTPYTRVTEPRRVAVIAVSSDSSLCGGFNANVIRRAKEVLDSYSSLGSANVELFTVGKKIAASLKKEGYVLNEELMSQASAPEYTPVAGVAYNLMKRFAEGNLDRIELVYTHFVSASKQVPVCETFLPIDITEYSNNETGVTNDFIVEPDKEHLVQQLLPKVIAMRLFTALLDSVAAEHAARMLAMQVATDNADELITTLVREYNKSRQQAITNELLDIMSGSLN